MKPKYVLHHLTLEEFGIIYDGWFENCQTSMEETRLICYNVFNASPNRTKSLDITEFMPFSWDKKSAPSAKVMSKDHFLILKSFIDQIN